VAARTQSAIRGLILAAIAGLVALGLILPAAPATAAFPGQNGRIAFTQVRLDVETLSADIFDVNPSGFPPRRLTDTGPSAEPAYSANGNKIAFTRNGEIFKMDADGRNVERLTDNQNFSRFTGHPTWSPNGNKIAFASIGPGDPGIFKMDPDGTDEERLSRNDNWDMNPSWSPNGNKIAFDRKDNSGDLEIFTMDADGSNKNNVTDNHRRDFEPNWSPNGNKIAFTSNRDGGLDIFKMDANGNDQRNVSNRQGVERMAAWSPNGNKIAFAGEGCHLVSEACLEIFKMDADGSDRERLTRDPQATNLMPDWQPTPPFR
jgi:Tol biopolymer transport system component